MQRRNFVFSAILATPLTSIGALREKKGIKVDSGQDRFNEPIKQGSLDMNVKISGKDTDGDLAMFESVMTGGGPPMHVHPDQDEIFSIIEGEFIFQIGDDKFQAKAGDTLFAPRNVPHAFTKVGDAPAKMILTYQPAGKIEQYFRKVGALAQIPSPEEYAKIFEAHGMKVVGPRLKA